MRRASLLFLLLTAVAGPAARAEATDGPAVPAGSSPAVEPADAEYPPESLLARHEATVVVRIGLDASGAVIGAEIVTGSGHPALDEAAREAALRCRVLPGAGASRREIALAYDFRLPPADGPLPGQARVPVAARVVPGAPEPRAAPAPAPASNWTFGGYGDFNATTRFFGPDPNKDYAPGSYRQTDVDLSRIVFLTSYDFTPWLSFRSELEFEHGGTGAAMEVEWDEFGEIEQEIEKGGEIVVEQALLEARFGKEYGLGVDLVGLRLGHLLVPVGMISYYHFPTMFGAVRRPESEEALLPSTWHESGAELFLRHRGVSLQLQALTGLDSTGFSSARFIAGGTQRKFEVARANDWAVAARLEYSGLRGLLVGGSIYTSNTTGNRPKRDMDDVDARTVLGDVHFRYQNGPLRLVGEAILGSLSNAHLITVRNASLAAALGAPKTPVASAAYAHYLECALNVLGLLVPDARHRVDLFLRYEGYDTMWKPPQEGSGFDNPLYERQVVTAGLNYFPHPRVVLKGEYVSRWINKDASWARRQDEVNFGLGFAL